MGGVDADSIKQALKARKDTILANIECVEGPAVALLACGWRFRAVTELPRDRAAAAAAAAAAAGR